MSHTKYVFVSNVEGVKNALANNTISILENGDEQADGGAALVAADTFQIAEKRYGTPVFKASDVIKVDATAYAAAQQQVDFITLNSNNNSEDYVVKIIDVTDGREKFAIATFEVPASASLAEAQSGIVTAINASKRDMFKDIVATADDATGTNGANVTGVIKITAPANTILRYAVNDASSVNAAGTATVAKMSVGTVADVNAEFQDGLPFLGVTNIAGPNVVSIGSNANGDYHRVTITVKAVVGDRTDLHEIVIYSKDTNNDTTITNLNTVFGLAGTISIS